MLLRIARLAQSRKVLPNTTLYYRTCTRVLPVLCCTTKVAQSTSQYFVLTTQLAQAPSSTTSYYKACTKYFPVLLCTTKPTEFTSQYYFVLQDFHKVLPGPVLLCSTRLAQNTSQYSMSPVVFAQAFCRKKLLNTETVHTEAFTQRSFYTQKLLRHRSFQTEKLSDRETFTHKRFYTQKLTKAFAHRSFYTDKFYTVKLYTQKLFTDRSFHTDREPCTQRSFYTQELQLQNRILAPKQTKMKHFSDFSQGIFKAKMEMSLLTNHRRNLDTASPIRFTTLSCKRPKYYTHSRCKP